MIKVASYNIRKAIGTDRLRRPGRIVEVLHEIDADIVVLQEADRRVGRRAAAISREVMARDTPYHAVLLGERPDSIGWHGNAILVRRTTVKVHARHRLALPTIEPRGAVAADLLIAGFALRVVGMHLDLSGLRRRRQARAILAGLDTLPPLPTVMMGDLNEWSLHGGCLREFASRFRMAATGPSYHARHPVARLDRIMVDDALNISACGVHRSTLAERASDHLPIWARLEGAPRAS